MIIDITLNTVDGGRVVRGGIKPDGCIPTPQADGQPLE